MEFQYCCSLGFVDNNNKLELLLQRELLLLLLQPRYITSSPDLILTTKNRLCCDLKNCLWNDNRSPEGAASSLVEFETRTTNEILCYVP